MIANKKPRNLGQSGKSRSTSSEGANRRPKSNGKSRFQTPQSQHEVRMKEQVKMRTGTVNILIHF